MTQYSGKVIRKTPVTPTQQSASGVWTTEDAAVAVRNNSWPVPGVPDPISRSVRLRSSASAYFSRTFSAEPSTYTLSVWCKRGALGAYETIAASRNAAVHASFLAFNTSDQLYCYLNDVSIFTTTAVFRDPSAWYHIVLKVTQSGAVVCYVNNQQVGSGTVGSSSYLFTNASGYVNAIGRYGDSSSNYFDGYLTEINFIDGQALTPSSFGTTDPTSGAWIPMAYTGTYGANGFYLNFKDNTSTTTIGYDYSGNANNWNANNISLTAGATYDSMLDVPTPWVGYSTTTDTSAVTRGNYCTFNPLNQGSYVTLSNGNLTITGNTAANSAVALSTMGMTSGKWYWETTITTVGGISYAGMGIAPAQNNAETYWIAIGSTGGCCWRNSGGSGGVGGFGNTSATYPSYTTGDVIGVAADFDNGALYFSKNGSWINSGVPTSGSSRTGATNTWTAGSITGFPGGGGYNGSVNDLNCGQRPLSYTPPTGFKTLCTTNLPTPTITNGANYMAATLWTGDGTNPRTITNTVNGVSFKPDLVWTKARNIAYDNSLYDSVRGVTNYLLSNSSAAEASAANTLQAFNSNGFQVGGNNYTNSGSVTYVGWQWQAGAGSSSSNTSGSITSTVSVNTTAGFSVVTYTGTGSDATVGHGLGVTPSMIIVKERSAVRFWFVNHTSISATQNLYLNTTDPVQSDGVFTSRSSTTFGVGSGVGTNESGGTYVAYCWAAVAGYSAFGSYTGNGSADGPFVYLGFRPRWVMIKRTDTTGSWFLIDTSRNPSNNSPNYLLADSSTTEGTDNVFDILSNGFKHRNTSASENASGGTYIYAAFAENPFKYSNAR